MTTLFPKENQPLFLKSQVSLCKITQYLRKAQTLDISAVDFDNSVPWLQGGALPSIPDSLHHGHTSFHTTGRHAEAQSVVSFALGQDHRHQLPSAQTAQTWTTSQTTSQTTTQTVRGAVSGGGSEVGVVRPDQAGVGAAGSSGRGHGPPGGLGQWQSGP